MKSYTVAAAIAGFASSVAAHGFISEPTPRMPGDGLKAACGDQVYNTQSSDHYGNVQGALQNFQGDHPDCRMWQCKGVPFSDAGEIFEYTPGQVIPMKVEIRAPHDGVANVSIVNIATDKVIGEPLISWDKYALTSSPISEHPDWTSFDITMPDVSTECANKGDCVIQWFWDAPSIDQTYESCIDFTMGGGSGSGNGTAPAAPSASSAPAASSAAPSSTPTAAEEAATPAATGGSASGSDSSLPESFTMDTFTTWFRANAASDSSLPKSFTIDNVITWLRANAGTGVADKVRRMIAAQRAHPRAFRA